MKVKQGFSLIELLLALAVIGIIAGVGVPNFLGWRANAMNAEAANTVKQVIAEARSRSKRESLPVSLVFTTSSNSIGGVQRNLPHGATISVSKSPLTLRFVPPFGALADFETHEIEVVTGKGAFARTSTIHVVPPLAKTGVTK